MMERQRIAREEEPVLPSRRESDLTVKTATNSVREMTERRDAHARDAAPRQLTQWEKEIADRIRKARENAPMPAWGRDALAAESAAEIEREAQEREARARADREQRAAQARADEARAKAEADRKARIGQLEFADRQRQSALEGLTAIEAEKVMTRAVAANLFDDPGAIEMIAKEVILNRPENSEQCEINQMVVSGMTEANARLVQEGSQYFTRRDYESMRQAYKEQEGA
jgi:hypothetical protein